ncbi:MAG: hypothetical protein IH602_20105 [Bryobacteraceae bacterium]|nr:hypothetical protein [Bryobacteraceae bacterium]
MLPATGSGVSGIDELARRIGELEARLASLEARIDLRPPEAAQQPEPAGLEPEIPDLPSTGQLAPLFGVSFLGLAGAYTLRALTEMGSIPVAAGVGIGLAYASAWLYAASRLNEDDRTATIFRGATASLILMPLLWEALVRFQALSSAATASLLVAYAILGFAVSWKRNLTSLAWITSISSLMTACALLVVTRDLIPFAWALLGIAVAVEASACLNHWLAERWAAAIALNLAALLIVYVVSRDGGLPPAYAAISQAGALAVLAGLLAVYLAGTVARTLWRGFVMTRFEIAQSVAAFAIAMGGALRISQGHPDAVLTVGLFSALGAALCYGVSAFFVTRHREHDRNFYVYSTFALLLALAAGLLLFSGLALIAVWVSLCFVLAAVGQGASRATFKWHGALYMAAALASSGLLTLVANRYFGVPHSPPAPPDPASLAGFAAAAAAYGIVAREPSPPPASLASRFLLFIFCMGAVWGAAGVAASLSTLLCSGPASGLPDFCPATLTAILALAAFGLAAFAIRSGRIEQAWAAWALLVLLTLKILLQDFRHSLNLGLVISLLLYGGSLVLLPRLLQRAARSSAAADRSSV